MTKKHISFAFATLAIAAISGCNPKPAVAPRGDVQALNSGTNLRVARSWPRKNIHIGPGGNKFFLWKLKMVEECPGRANLPFPGMNNPGGPTRPKFGPCPSDVAFVLNTSNRPGTGLTALDDRSFLIQKEQNAIRQDVLSKNLRNSVGAPLGVEDLINLIDNELPRVAEYDQARTSASNQQATFKDQRKQKQEQLDNEQNKPTSEQDPNLIAQLKRDIAALDTKIANAQRRIDQFSQKINDAQNAPLMVADNMLEGSLDMFRKDVKQRDEIAMQTDGLLNQIKSTVDFYDYSDQLTTDVTFNDDGTIDVDLKNWDFRVAGPDGTPIGEEGEKSFSTSDGSITNVTYVELPGTFEWDVHAADARFHFKVSRTRYGSSDGLVHLNGDILRYSNDGSDALNPRRGIAVMDEPNTSAATQGPSPR